jgi:hypothetical protein
VKPLYRKTLLRFLPIVFNLERANQLSPLPDKDLADFCPLIEPYQVTKNLETISWTTPLDNPSPNWREFAGIFENDADFQEIMDTLQAERTLDDDSEVDPSYYL